MNRTPKPHIGLKLPDLFLPVTRKLVSMGAAASRDWQPQHHDPDWAREAGLPDIIMNNYTQAGLISRFVTDWSGPAGRIGRLRFAMRRPLCPVGNLTIRGAVVDLSAESDTLIWTEIDAEILVGDDIVTTATIRVALPGPGGDSSAWHCSGSRWNP